VETELLAQKFHALQSDNRQVGYGRKVKERSDAEADYVSFDINKVV
jgi:hypothetical protein